MIEGQRDHFVRCQCDVSNHIVRFTYWPRTEKHEPEMWIHCQLSPVNSFWGRLKLALKYLFNRGPKDYWGFWAETLLDFDEMIKLEQFMENCAVEWCFGPEEGEKHVKDNGLVV